MTVTIYTPRKVKKVADLLCGAGGTLAGTCKALHDRGYAVDALAINHDDDAIATHQANHPDVRHFTTGIDEADPEPMVNEILGGYVDYLMCSPACTHFSRARGGKPVEDQLRSHAHTVPRWITRVPCGVVIIENVPDFMRWGPTCTLHEAHGGRHTDQEWPPAPPEQRCNRTIKEREREFYEAWVSDIQRAGWTYEPRLVNAADYGVPTTRTRFFAICRRNRQRVYWPARTHCDPKKLRAGGEMFGRTDVLPWVPASKIIRWERLGKSLFDPRNHRRDGKAKADNTLSRLARGALKHWGPLGPVAVEALTDVGLSELSTEVQEARQRLLVFARDANDVPIVPLVFANRMNNVPRSALEEPAPCVTTAGGGGLGIVEAALQPVDGLVLGQNTNNLACPASDAPVPTLVTIARVQVARAELNPVIVSRQSGTPDSSGRSVDSPMPTATGRGAGYLAEGILEPVDGLVLGQQGGSVADAAGDAPVPTVASAGYITLTEANLEPLQVPYFGQSESETTKEPMRTITTKERYALAQPFVTHYYGGSDDRLQRADSEISEPVPTIPTANRFGLVQGIVMPYGPTADERSTDQPMPTVLTKDRLAVSQGMLMQLSQTGGHGDYVRDAEEQPFPTLCTKADLAVAQAMLVQTDNGSSPANGRWSDGTRSVDEPATTITTSGKLALAEAVIVPHWNECQRANGQMQSPRFKTDAEPTESITSRGAGDIARLGLESAQGKVSLKRLVRTADGSLFMLDITFRMFDTDELADAQGCYPGWIFPVGMTKQARTKQLGNMVCPPVAEALVGAQLDGQVNEGAYEMPTEATPLPNGRDSAVIRTQRRKRSA